METVIDGKLYSVKYILYNLLDAESNVKQLHFVVNDV